MPLPLQLSSDSTVTVGGMVARVAFGSRFACPRLSQLLNLNRQKRDAIRSRPGSRDSLKPGKSLRLGTENASP